MLNKYSQNYNLPVFYFVSLEAGTVAFKIFCVMIPSLVDTSLDFGLFMVVRPYLEIYIYFFIFFWSGMKLQGVLSNKFFKFSKYIENRCPRSPLKNH